MNRRTSVFVDDNGARRISAIARIEEAPLDERHAKRLQIVGRPYTEQRVRQISRTELTPLDTEDSRVTR